MDKYTKLNSIILHYYTYLVRRSKMKLTHTETQTPSHSQSGLHTHTHTYTRRLYVCKLGWMGNLTHTHMFTITGLHPFMEFIVRVRRLKAFCVLIKQMQEYINTRTNANSIIIHYYSYLIIRGKVKLTQYPRTHARTHTHTHTHT